MGEFFRSLALVLLLSNLLITSIMADDHLEDPYDKICSPVRMYFPDCAKYLGGFYTEPSNECCGSIKMLNGIAKKSKKGPKMVCWCIEAYMVPQNFHLNASRNAELSQKCHTSILFPISETMNCSFDNNN